MLFCIFCIFCVVLCIVCFVSFSVLFVCVCVLYYCHRVATQFQLNISYHISYIIHNKSYIISYPIIYHILYIINHIILYRIVSYISFTHLVVCLTTGPEPLPKRALHIVRSRASSFKWEYPLLSLRSSNNFLRLLPCLPVTSIPPCIFPSITRCRRQFRRKMWPIQFAFRLRISYHIISYRIKFNTGAFYEDLPRNANFG